MACPPGPWTNVWRDPSKPISSPLRQNQTRIAICCDSGPPYPFIDPFSWPYIARSHSLTPLILNIVLGRPRAHRQTPSACAFWRLAPIGDFTINTIQMWSIYMAMGPIRLFSELAKMAANHWYRLRYPGSTRVFIPQNKCLHKCSILFMASLKTVLLFGINAFGKETLPASLFARTDLIYWRCKGMTFCGSFQGWLGLIPSDFMPEWNWPQGMKNK